VVAVAPLGAEARAGEKEAGGCYREQ